MRITPPQIRAILRRQAGKSAPRADSGRTHSGLKRAILAYLATVPGVVALPMNVGAFAGEYKGKRRFVRFGVPGLPDIIGWWRGCRKCGYVPALPTCEREGYYTAHFIAVEVKVGRDKLRPEQIAFRDRLVAAGGRFVEARSVDDVVKEIHR